MDEALKARLSNQGSRSQTRVRWKILPLRHSSAFWTFFRLCNAFLHYLLRIKYYCSPVPEHLYYAKSKKRLWCEFILREPPR